MIKDRVFIGGGLAVLATAVYTAVVLPTLPATIPVHWGIDGQPDRFSDKGSGAWFLVGMMAVMWLVFLVVPHITTKTKSIADFRPVWDTTVVIVLAFMAVVQVITLQGANQGAGVVKFIMAGVCVLFVLIGNVLGKTTPNYFMGIRTPWTLESPLVWERTHRLAARLMVGAGLFGFVASFVGLYWAVVPLVLASALVPVVYSYVLYKKTTGANGLSSP